MPPHTIVVPARVRVQFVVGVVEVAKGGVGVGVGVVMEQANRVAVTAPVPLDTQGHATAAVHLSGRAVTLPCRWPCRPPILTRRVAGALRRCTHPASEEAAASSPSPRLSCGTGAASGTLAPGGWLLLVVAAPEAEAMAVAVAVAVSPPLQRTPLRRRTTAGAATPHWGSRIAGVVDAVVRTRPRQQRELELEPELEPELELGRELDHPPSKGSGSDSGSGRAVGRLWWPAQSPALYE